MPGNPQPTTCFPSLTKRPLSISTTTTTYLTAVGPTSLTWSRSLLGLSLTALLPLPSSLSSTASTHSSTSSSSAHSTSAALFHLRPHLPWSRRGRKRFRRGASVVLFSWDLSGATFATSAPDPTSGFHLSVAVDGEVVLVVGDKQGRRDEAVLPVSRRERVVVREGRRGAGRALEHVTSAWVGGVERRVAVELGGRGDKDVRMCVAVDGKRVLQVKRLRWKFRGTERVDLDGSTAAILVSWDVHDYLFPVSAAAATASSPAPPPESNHAVILFRFDTEPNSQLWTRPTSAGVWGLYGLLGLGERVAVGGVGSRRKLMKTRSASSLSSVASTGSAWSVAEWQSAEENELKEVNGFSLLVTFERR